MQCDHHEDDIVKGNIFLKHYPIVLEGWIDLNWRSGMASGSLFIIASIRSKENDYSLHTVLCKSLKTPSFNFSMNFDLNIYLISN